MAPTPASAQVTEEPTENQWDWTATPISPVAGSRATIENVCASGSAGAGGAVTASAARINPEMTGRMRPLEVDEAGLRLATGDERPNRGVTATQPRSQTWATDRAR